MGLKGKTEQKFISLRLRRLQLLIPTRHRASASMYSLTFRVGVCSIATQPVHQLQIRPIVHN